MAFSNETPRTLRLYFGFVAAFGAFYSVQLIDFGYATSDHGILILGGFYALTVLGFLFVAMTLPRLLRNAPNIIIAVVCASILVDVVLILFQIGAGFSNLLGPVLGIAIGVYLIANVKRLASQP